MVGCVSCSRVNTDFIQNSLQGPECLALTIIRWEIALFKDNAHSYAGVVVRTNGKQLTDDFFRIETTPQQSMYTLLVTSVINTLRYSLESFA